jgi:hypothetical protein
MRFTFTNFGRRENLDVTVERQFGVTPSFRHYGNYVSILT